MFPLDTSKVFLEYCKNTLVLGGMEVFGCNKLCSFKNHGIAKSTAILEF